MGIRINLVRAGFIVVFILLLSRLFYWQILQASNLASQARMQYKESQSIFAPRGNILASDGTWLAARGETWLMYAELPKINKLPQQIADKLAPLIVEESDEEGNSQSAVLSEANRLKSLLTKSGVVWVPLKHKLTPDVKRNIEALGIKGVGFESEEGRIYPEASSAAHLLGFVGKNKEGEDTGYFGMEGFYNLTLSGKSGFLSRERDVAGIPILIGQSSEIPAIKGIDLLTHIDKSIQLLLEAKLEEGIEKYGASAGTVIVMDPISGALLASSSYPSYDPMSYSEFSDGLFRDPAVSLSFEPGSIFKVLIMSAALDAKAVDMEDKCEICTGPIKIDKYTIETWDNKYHPDSSMQDILVHSDNVGMVYVGQKLGAKRMREYLLKFGIGKLTEIDLQGEMSPELRKMGEWSNVDVTTASFGQGVAVTPIQMLNAVSAIANGGISATPQVVDKLIGNGWEEDIKPVVGQRVISKKTAREVTSMMVEAASSGEAKWTHKKGFSVAGKTGTAQIPIAGHYDKEKTIASFIGFAPADKPKFIMLVTLREPQSSPWASETAAPLWYSIANELFLHFGIQPED